MVQRFLHLSDIHFGQKAATAAKHDHIRTALVKDAKDLFEKRGVATRVLITGDISYSGQPDEYKTATTWLEKLTAACGCLETQVSTIPGNHDCDRSAISNQARMVSATLRAHNPEVIQTTLAEINQDGEAANPFLPKLQAYRQFASAYGCDFESPARPMWTQEFDLDGGFKLKLHGLTSVQVSNAEDALGNMILGNQQYMITEVSDVVNVALVHHPLNWFKDVTEASRFLHNNARVIMVGHEHSLSIQTTKDALVNKEWLTIRAGATNPPEGDTYGYMYNWIEFSCEEKLGHHNLIVDIFPRAWMPHSVKFDADHSRLAAAAEFVRIEIPCPNLRLNTGRGGRDIVAPAKTQPSIAVHEDAKMSSPAPTAESTASRQEGATMVTTDATGFDRLRYLFWRYLDWQQRLKVLVDVDALPKTANQPVPQTLERVALETVAQSSDKLHDLWEAMMPLLPAEKRATNPFKSTNR